MSGYPSEQDLYPWAPSTRNARTWWLHNEYSMTGIRFFVKITLIHYKERAETQHFSIALGTFLKTWPQKHMMKSRMPQVQGPLRTGPETTAKLHSSCSRNRQKAHGFSELHLFYGMVRTEERMFFTLPNQQWKQTCNLRIFEPSGTWKKNKLFLTFLWLQLNLRIIS